ncbi:hypothetical protein QO001_003196 [Methylobacterium brachiatum]|uniref:Uncharacterized protein n=1 Tax=Methylobacterium brachiatum TaxID=269660 RepID=A0AAJ1TVN6_9HYPH|nr:MULTISPECIES: hypothetical protein [Methylobacterium]MCB4801530.1 hypothetical protein [Methylobacterium brachiatum]MCJ2086147.1 hypothetical protein [Methylobacterium sp. E-005]MDQ0544262.1 hypothetical protein [Methylobacterium brachiatum]
MIAAFFADDTSASQAALLASSALDRRVDDDDAPPSLVAGGGRIVEALPSSLDAARADGRHLMVALPLAHLGDRAVRSRVDVAVVSFGPRPLAASAALRAMAADALPDLPPPWLLACCGSARPAGLRALPVTLKALRRDKAARLLAGEPCADLRSHSAGLAAALYLVAADPHAPRLDPGCLNALFDAVGTAADLTLRTALLELADDLDGEASEVAGPSARRMTVPRPIARRRPRASGLRRFGTAKPHIAPRQTAGCACATLA